MDHKKEQQPQQQQQRQTSKSTFKVGDIVVLPESGLGCGQDYFFGEVTRKTKTGKLRISYLAQKRHDYVRDKWGSTWTTTPVLGTYDGRTTLTDSTGYKAKGREQWFKYNPSSSYECNEDALA